MSFHLLQILNGLSMGLLYFLIAAGLSLTFGVLRIVNLAQGAFYLVGAYVAIAVHRDSGSFLLSVLAGSLAAGVVGGIVQRWLLEGYKLEATGQVLLTFGVLLIFADGCLWMWGSTPLAHDKPEILTGSIGVYDLYFPIYRLFLLGTGLVVAAALWLVMERTPVGSLVRATVDDRQMVASLGYNTGWILTIVFSFGTALAGFAGSLGAVVTGSYPTLAFEIMLIGFVVTVVGGLGNLKGALLASLMIGMIDAYGKALFPQLALVTIFIPMIVTLAIRPRGLASR